jgi:nucleotide-binding universal stress UspA family protein
MFNRILVPTDFSEPSDAALDYARRLARRFGASLHLLHVIEPIAASGMLSNEMYIGTTPGMYELLVKEAQAKFSARAFPPGRAPGRTTTEVMTGHSAQTIVDYAEDQRIDLIVMGTHGRTGLAHLLMGSVAEHVVRTAPCPVMTVRQGPKPQPVRVLRSDQISQCDIALGPG